uniref:Uncharacterized protein n=1 Tax=Anguilla anguilla TaxID=7936 RepID=A0A0E9UTJ5_ANGAN
MQFEIKLYYVPEPRVLPYARCPERRVWLRS